jgi:hypothetical protein
VLVLLVPAILGILFIMCLKNCESYYLEIAEDGFVITSPVERIKIDARDISGVRRSRLTGSLIVTAGIRRITVGNVTERAKSPGKTSLLAWLAAPAPSRLEINATSDALMGALTQLMTTGREKL